MVAVAVVVILVPGPDFAVVTKNTLTGGRRRGLATGAGAALSSAVQALAAAAGLGALIVGSQPVFQAIRWAGVAYLAYLAVQSLRSAWRGNYADDAPEVTRRGGLRQGFLCNITNPKVLVFYLAVLPQFMVHGSAIWVPAVLALTHPAIAMAYLAALVALMDRASAWLKRRRVRRTLDAATATALAAFSLRLATEA